MLIWRLKVICERDICCFRIGIELWNGLSSSSTSASCGNICRRVKEKPSSRGYKYRRASEQYTQGRVSQLPSPTPVSPYVTRRSMSKRNIP
jgi:hypothetical protein